jgi:hypothetical protein
MEFIYLARGLVGRPSSMNLTLLPWEFIPVWSTIVILWEVSVFRTDWLLMVLLGLGPLLIENEFHGLLLEILWDVWVLRTNWLLKIVWPRPHLIENEFP